LGVYPVNIFKPILWNTVNNTVTEKTKTVLDLIIVVWGLKKAEKENAVKSKDEEIQMKIGILYPNLLNPRESKGSSKNSEATREEMLDEIKAL
jgi:hypothetical protein